MSVEDHLASGGHNTDASNDITVPTIPNMIQPPSSANAAMKDFVSPYTSAPAGKKQAKNKGGLRKAGSNANVGAAKQFLKKDHHDSNMVVAVRLRPLS